MQPRSGIVRLLWLTIATGLVAGYFAPARAGLAAPLDNAAVVMNFYSAYNARDLDTAIALFAADAVVNRPPNPSATGKAEITSWLQETWGRNVHLDRPSAPQLAGDKVTLQSKISSDPLIRLGLAPLDQVDEFVVQNGMITVYTYSLTVESTNKITAAAGPPTCLPGSTCPSGAPTNAPPGAPLPPAGAPPPGNAPAVSAAPTVLPATGGGFRSRSDSLAIQAGSVLLLGALAVVAGRGRWRRSARRSR